MFVAVIRTGGTPDTRASLPLDRERDRIYAIGTSAIQCRDAFLGQIAGASGATKRILLDRRAILLAPDDEASEIAEMIAAPAIGWEDYTPADPS